MMGYQRYISKGLLISTLVVALSLTAIVWLMQALRLIDYIVNQGVSIPVFLSLSALLVPNVLFFVLPVAAFIATVFFYNKLKTDSEVSVLYAVGISRVQLAIPAMMLAAVVMLVGYVLSLYVLPVTTREYRNMQFFLRNNFISVMLQEGVFATPTDNLMVYIRERDSARELRGVLVHDMRNKQATVTMMAERAVIAEGAQGPEFILERGNRQEMRDGKLSFLSFESYPLNIASFANDATNRREDMRELSVPELFARADDVSIPERERNRGRAEAHQRLLWPLLTQALVAIGVAALLSGDHNRRLRWRRNIVAVVCGAILVFIIVSMRSIMATHPHTIPLAYALVLIPTLFSALLLCDLQPRLLHRQRAGA